ncbi:hypothetical protein WR30_18210 [Burkholderia contaminans FFH2055]|nr:hypothetical protein NL30_37410 [Burkholderia contaminans]KKL35626.1 hypothetical protein WR30_18210 [Burkholderia contaminans FFH2055]
MLRGRAILGNPDDGRVRELDGGEQVGDGAAGDLADWCVHVSGCAGGDFDGGDGDAAHDWLPDRKAEAR